ncbi:MAG: glutamate 5-kinase [Oscillospiraceae bacterium]|jgi:glutamate 5-kinase
MESGSIIVVKVGTSSITDASGSIDASKIKAITDQVSALHSDGYKPVIVTSGAIAAGFRCLGFKKRPKSIPEKQASASVGQGLLMELYSENLMADGITCGQLLLDREDFADRTRYKNAFNSVQVLLSHGAVPIINENDAISIDEIKIGDNDTLSAQVAAMIHAKVLVLLTDIDGLYTADPRKDPGARHIDTVEEITPEILALAGGAGSDNGTGGMVTKLRGAAIASAAGVLTVICSFKEESCILKAVSGKARMTVIKPMPSVMHVKKQWMAFYANRSGCIYVDDGAAAALRARGSSLLSAGVVSYEGDFITGDVIDVYTMGEHEYLGCGIARCSKAALARACGNHEGGLEVINRDDWVGSHGLPAIGGRRI